MSSLNKKKKKKSTKERNQASQVSAPCSPSPAESPGTSPSLTIIPGHSSSSARLLQTLDFIGNKDSPQMLHNRLGVTSARSSLTKGCHSAPNSRKLENPAANKDMHKAMSSSLEAHLTENSSVEENIKQEETLIVEVTKPVDEINVTEDTHVVVNPALETRFMDDSIFNGHMNEIPLIETGLVEEMKIVDEKLTTEEPTAITHVTKDSMEDSTINGHIREGSLTETGLVEEVKIVDEKMTTEESTAITHVTKDSVLETGLVEVVKCVDERDTAEDAHATVKQVNETDSTEESIVDVHTKEAETGVVEEPKARDGDTTEHIHTVVEPVLITEFLDKYTATVHINDESMRGTGLEEEAKHVDESDTKDNAHIEIESILAPQSIEESTATIHKDKDSMIETGLEEGKKYIVEGDTMEDTHIKVDPVLAPQSIDGATVTTCINGESLVDPVAGEKVKTADERNTTEDAHITVNYLVETDHIQNVTPTANSNENGLTEVSIAEEAKEADERDTMEKVHIEIDPVTTTQSMEGSTVGDNMKEAETVLVEKETPEHEKHSADNITDNTQMVVEQVAETSVAEESSEPTPITEKCLLETNLTKKVEPVEPVDGRATTEDKCMVVEAILESLSTEGSTITHVKEEFLTEAGLADGAISPTKIPIVHDTTKELTPEILISSVHNQKGEDGKVDAPIATTNQLSLDKNKTEEEVVRDHTPTPGLKKRLWNSMPSIFITKDTSETPTRSFSWSAFDAIFSDISLSKATCRNEPFTHTAKSLEPMGGLGKDKVTNDIGMSTTNDVQGMTLWESLGLQETNGAEKEASQDVRMPSRRRSYSLQGSSIKSALGGIELATNSDRYRHYNMRPNASEENVLLLTEALSLESGQRRHSILSNQAKSNFQNKHDMFEAKKAQSVTVSQTMNATKASSWRRTSLGIPKSGVLEIKKEYETRLQEMTEKIELLQRQLKAAQQGGDMSLHVDRSRRDRELQLTKSKMEDLNSMLRDAAVKEQGEKRLAAIAKREIERELESSNVDKIMSELKRSDTKNE
eukprot:Ihof_evm6s228 gene=Ihof_evmTU6s228